VSSIPQNPLVTNLSGALATPSTASGLAGAPALPELVTLVGYISGTIKHAAAGATAAGTDWVLVYRDWRMTTWLLVEGAGILHHEKLLDDRTDNRARDVLWVRRDTAVGRGSGPQSDEARFLTGQFTRAGDFDQLETGGQSSPETGLFCPTTPLCNCGPRSRY
jgi:hypothetical protein